MARQASNHASMARSGAGGAGPTVSRVLVIASCIAAVGAMLYGHLGPAAGAPGPSAPPTSTVVALPLGTSTSSDDSASPVNPTPTSAPTEVIPSVTPSPSVPRVGVVAGHWGSDQGAVCPDGLAEVEINRDVAEQVVRSLRALGYQADLLKEYDARLRGYRADALISIHADSCEPYPGATPPASGFKVASVEDSLVPAEEERLVACLAKCYATRTGMYFHENSITYDMTRYHSFYEIDGRTPGAIIETGFMHLDRRMLIRRSNRVAQGIVEGIVCFVEGKEP